jgi:alginate O-acetyltransferase complex protein AlgI
MLFNSYAFAIFFVIVYGLYWAMRKSFRWQNLLLLCAGYVFYGWWDVRFLYLIILTTLIDYWSCLCVANGKITFRERMKVSVLIVLAALFFVTIRWDAFAFQGSILHPTITVEWGRLVPSDLAGWWVVLGSIAGVTVYNLIYAFALRLSFNHFRKLFLFLNILVSLSILGVFKYFNFFVDSFLDLVNTAFGLSLQYDMIKIILPVGISFYTFQTISRAVDVYRGKISANATLSEVAAYVAFFPQMVAGPIERGDHLLPQFQRARTITPEGFREGCWLVLWGLYKKMVIADNVSAIANQIFNPYDSLSTLAVPHDGLRMLVAIYAFAVQIYCDFSGYSDIARGTAKLMGFEIMVNFNLPYFAVDPSDFWKRWHISLSSWLRDYLYIPLGGNKKGTWGTYKNLFTTMLLGGLWHGASWTFVLWGAFHGLILIVYRLFSFGSGQIGKLNLGQFAKGVVMFHLVCFGWLLFRAQNVDTVRIFLQSIFTHPFGSPEAAQAFRTLAFYSGFLILFQVVQGWTHTLNPLRMAPRFVRLNVYIFLFMSLFALSATGKHEFIYFAF